MRVLAPSGALADQRHLGVALDDHEALDERRQGRDRAPGDLGERRPLVAEDARVAVLVGPHRATDAHVVEHTLQQEHRVLDPRILRVRLDPLELGLGLDSLDLELGYEHGEVAGRVRGDSDRPLRGQEAEVGEVLDVLLVEEHEAAETLALDVLQEPPAPLLQLRGRDADRLHLCSSASRREYVATGRARSGGAAEGRRDAEATAVADAAAAHASTQAASSGTAPPFRSRLRGHSE